MTNPSNRSTPSQSSAKSTPKTLKGAPPNPPGTFAITKTIHPGKLLRELHALHGMTGAVRRQGSQFTLTLHNRPGSVTDAQIQTVINAHTPSTAADSPQAQLQNWSKLTPAQKDALLLGALQRIYGTS